MLVAAERPRSPARLAPDARRHQLVLAAMPVAARGGLGNVALDAVAARAGVTRNLLYHYFPRGRRDVEIAVAGEAEGQLDLADPTESDPLSRMLEHALAPTHAWRIHRWAVASPDPEIRDIAGRATDQLTLKLSRLHRLDDDLEPLVATALRGYVAFAEAALDSGRSMALSRPALLELLRRTLGGHAGSRRAARPIARQAPGAPPILGRPCRPRTGS